MSDWAAVAITLMLFAAALVAIVYMFEDFGDD